MSETGRKTTKKRKFSLYLDGELMERVGKVAEKKDRSVNYIVEGALKSYFNYYPKG